MDSCLLLCPAHRVTFAHALTPERVGRFEGVGSLGVGIGWLALQLVQTAILLTSLPL